MLAPWRSPLAHALHRNRSLVHARYLQLATVRPDGRPANRTVVFRGFLEPTNQLKITTDTRSEKATQIALCPWGEICWYFPKTREQLRLFGRLTLVDAHHPDAALMKARQIQWHDFSDASRVQFEWAAPGQPRDPADPFSPPPPDPDNPLPNFCLVLFDPIQVDHLELRGDPQTRSRYTLDDQEGWQVESVNP